MIDLFTVKPRPRFAFVPLAAVVVFSAAVLPAQAAATTPASVMVFDQDIAEKSVMIDYAYLPASGFLAVYSSDAKGQPSGEPIAKLQLEAGDHRSINVTLDKAVASGDALWVSIYKDANANQTFEPGGGDVAYWDPGKLPAPNKFIVKTGKDAA